MKLIIKKEEKKVKAIITRLWRSRSGCASLLNLTKELKLESSTTINVNVCMLTYLSICICHCKIHRKICWLCLLFCLGFFPHIYTCISHLGCHRRLCQSNPRRGIASQNYKVNQAVYRNKTQRNCPKNLIFIRKRQIRSSSKGTEKVVQKNPEIKQSDWRSVQEMKRDLNGNIN